MITGKLTSKGQITILKEVRENMGLKAGETLEFIFTLHRSRYSRDSRNCV